VGDEEQSKAEAAAEAGEEGDDLGLDGDVEGGGGFVGDEQLGAAGDGHGDEDALAHAAGELVGVLAEAGRWVADADKFEGFDGEVAGFAAAEATVGADDVDELGADGEDGIEAGGGVLEHNRDGAAAELAHGCLVEAGEVLAVEADAAGGDAAGRAKEAEDGEGGLAFAGAAFADQADGFAGVHGEAHAADDFERAAAGGEADVEVFEF